MPVFSRDPVYNLKTVLQETGLKADALRMWEEHYGLPLPARSLGGQRRYSRYDIETIRWLVKRQGQGLRIAEAVEEWQNLAVRGSDPLDNESEAGNTPAAAMIMNTPLDDLRAEWIRACMGFDELSAEMLLNQAFVIYPVETVCVQVLQAGLHEMGERWYTGDGSVQQEHFASSLAIRRLEALIAANLRPPQAETVLIGCAAREWHTFPGLLLTLLLRRKGLKVVYLGANTPSAHLVETIRAVRPSLVVLMAQSLVSAAELRRAAAALQEEGIQAAYGGWIFNQEPDLVRRIPAHYLGRKIEESSGMIQQLCSAPEAAPLFSPADAVLLNAARAFKQKRAQIENELVENSLLRGMDPHNIEMGNHFLGDSLAAALDLGDVAYLRVDMEWFNNRVGENLPPASPMVGAFTAAYARSVNKHLGADGRLISAWLESRAGRLPGAGDA